MYDRHGPVMHALADAATVDPDVERTYNAIMQSFIDAIAKHIEDEIKAGRVLPLDAEGDRAGAVPDERRAICSPRSGGRGPRSPRRSSRRSRRSGRGRSTARTGLVQLAAEPEPEQRRAAGDQPDARRPRAARARRGPAASRRDRWRRRGSPPSTHGRGAEALARRVGGPEPDHEVARAERRGSPPGWRGGASRGRTSPPRRARERASGRRRRGRGRGPAHGRAVRASTERRTLVLEVPAVGEDHRDAGGVRGLDDLGVALGAARLDDAGRARVDRELRAVGEREEGVRGER